jgi:glycosyltransferase involved in cell wall biosynthesis
MLRKLAKPMGDDCVFTGALLDPPPVMAGADLYVCPARHHGISNSIIEACALGKPIIATDVGQTNEIVHNGHNGHLVKIGDVTAIKDYIIKLKDSPKKRERLGHFGVGFVRREFNIDIQSPKYLELYEKLLSQIQ